MALDGTQASTPPRPRRAKIYNRTRLTVGIISSTVSLVFLVSLVATGGSRALAQWASSVSSDSYLALMLYALGVGLGQFLLTLPFTFYSGYVVEHRYHLSNQSLGRWGWENLKAMALALPFVGGGVLVVYACLLRFGEWWWLPVCVLITCVTVLFARLAPVILFPMFYTFTPLGEGSLKERITRLCVSAGVSIQGIFSFNLSKNTKKANAGFAGIGRAKRIILGDTLITDFSEDEIETVFAHELGHYVNHHLVFGMVTGAGATFLAFFAGSRLYSLSLGLLGFNGATDLAALPLLAIWLSLFALVTAPFGNFLSRRHERQADRYAVEKTGNPLALASALHKLCATNLADPTPHPLVEFLFYSHPSIARRVKAIEEVGQG